MGLDGCLLAYLPTATAPPNIVKWTLKLQHISSNDDEMPNIIKWTPLKLEDIYDDNDDTGEISRES